MRQSHKTLALWVLLIVVFWAIYHIIAQDKPPKEKYTYSKFLRQVDDGWTWKFDPGLFRAISRTAAAEQLPRITSRVALVRSEYGLVTPEIGQIIYDNLGRVAPVVEIPLAGHHMMLDQPLILLTALRALLADWEHSVPLHR